MNNSLAALNVVREILRKNADSIYIKKQFSEQADSEITEYLLKKYDFNGNYFFNKGTQQAVDNITKEVLLGAKARNLLESRSRGPFNRKLSLSLTDAQRKDATDSTRKILEKYFETRGVKFVAEDYTPDAKNIVIDRIINHGFIAEGDSKGGFQFRRLVPVDGALYLSPVIEGDKVINDFAGPFIDHELSNLTKAEIHANIREKAQRLAGPQENVNSKDKTLAENRNPSKVDQYFDILLKRHNNLKFLRSIRYNATNESLKDEFENYALWQMGLNRELATLQDTNLARVKAQHTLELINNYQAPGLSDADKVYLNYESKVTIPY